MRITAPRKALLKRLDEPMSKVDHQALGMLSGKELAELVRMLDKVRAARTETRPLTFPSWAETECDRPPLHRTAATQPR